MLSTPTTPQGSKLTRFAFPRCEKSLDTLLVCFDGLSVK